MPMRPRRAAASGREETEEERLDRNLGELLQELRVALPGVQVLFAFLLAVPFQQQLQPRSVEFEEKVYFATLLLTALSAALLIAPSAYHRLTFRYQQKRRLVFLANRLRDRRPRHPGAGDDLRGDADHRRPLRHRRRRRSSPRSLVLTMFVVLWAVLPLKRRLRYRRRGPAAARSAREATELAPRARRGTAAPAPRARSIASVGFPDLELELERHLELGADRLALRGVGAAQGAPCWSACRRRRSPARRRRRRATPARCSSLRSR